MKGVPSWDLEPFKLIQRRIQDTARKMIYMKNAPTPTTTTAEALPKVEEATATTASSTGPPGGNPITLGSSIPTSSPMRS